MSGFRYFPNSKGDIKKIYKFLGIKDKKELFNKIVGDIPLIGQGELKTLGTGLDESSLLRFFSDINFKLSGNGFITFAGGGVYNHFVPPAIDALISRGEFLTPYTPYQPEVSQGTLMALFEFQSMVSEITGMDVVNASMYDGAESLSEAVLMSLRLFDPSSVTGNKVLVSAAVNPVYLSLIKTYAGNIKADIEIINIDPGTGKTDTLDLKNRLNGKVSSVVIQQPNYFGVIEDLDIIEPVVHGFNPRPFFVVSNSEPICFGTINPPGFYNADIFAGEGNSFGNYMNFGGPLLGIFGSKKEYVRQMPGRIVGKTKDASEEDAYAFILSTREQHIRRAAATSNICTNNSLNAVRASIYLSLCSKNGFKELSLLNLKISHVFYERLLSSGLFEPVFSGDFFNEFTLMIKNKNISPGKFLEGMAERGIMAGVEAGRGKIIVACTENNTMEDIEKYVTYSQEIIGL